LKSLAILVLLLVPRVASAYTAEEYLAIFSTKAPGFYSKDPARFARIAVAAARAERKLIKRFRHQRYLGAILATVALNESGLWPDTHEGTRRGKAGEICLTQIHPRNPKWRRWAPSFESLAGTDIASTELCFLAAGETLIGALGFCLHRHYYTNWAAAMFTNYHYGDRCWLSPHAYPRARYMTAIASRKWVPTPEQRKLLEALLRPTPPQDAGPVSEASDEVEQHVERVSD
jgi:hypothetical protein